MANRLPQSIWKRKQYIPDMTTSRACGKCFVVKAALAFGRVKGTRTGLDSACKKCRLLLFHARLQSEQGLKEKMMARTIAWKKANPQREREILRKHRLKKKYGVTLAWYQKSVEEQRGLCAICANPPGGRWKALAVDHDHVSGLRRNLLCNRCNIVLGEVSDNTELLSAMVLYVQRHRAMTNNATASDGPDVTIPVTDNTSAIVHQVSNYN